MAKRNAGAKVKATKDTRGLGAGGSSLAGRSEQEGGGKTLVQLQAEKIAEKYFTDMMAAAGVHVDRMALEVMFWLPRDFMDLYTELYMRALRNTDGGTGERGKAAAETGALGRAKGKAQTGKKYKKYWTVADENVLEMKGRVDRRLRSICRDMRTELEELDFKRSRGEKTKVRVSAGRRIHEACPECKIIVSLGWKYCPKCGADLHHKSAVVERELRAQAESMHNRQA
jgi:hypothetical protein